LSIVALSFLAVPYVLQGKRGAEALQILCERIARLYAIEKALRGRSDAERRVGRQAHAKPLAAALKRWFVVAQLDQLAEKSDTAKALRLCAASWGRPDALP
jgi:hypothetical protein